MINFNDVSAATFAYSPAYYETMIDEHIRAKFRCDGGIAPTTLVEVWLPRQHPVPPPGVLAELKAKYLKGGWALDLDTGFRYLSFGARLLLRDARNPMPMPSNDGPFNEGGTPGAMPMPAQLAA
jgi:hypothetical protein